MHKRTIEKCLNDMDNHNGVVAHLEMDTLECEVKWVLGITTTNKASESDIILAELFKILKYDVVKVLHPICCKFGKLSSGNKTGNGLLSFQSQRREMPSDVQTTVQLLASVCSKSFKLGFSST